MTTVMSERNEAKSVSREEKLKTARQASLSRPFYSELFCLKENVIGENAAFSEQSLASRWSDQAKLNLIIVANKIRKESNKKKEKQF